MAELPPFPVRERSHILIHKLIENTRLLVNGSITFRRQEKLMPELYRPRAPAFGAVFLEYISVRDTERSMVHQF